MRSHPGSYRLTFLLPAGAIVCHGSHQPSPDGCRLTVTSPLVEIIAPSREAAFEHAARLLRVACRGQVVSIAVRLERPPPPTGSDAWTAIVGADVAFSPTALDPHLPAKPAALALVSSP